MSLINSEYPELRETSRLVRAVRNLATSLNGNRFWSYTTSERIIKNHPWIGNTFPYDFDKELATVLLEYYRINPTENQMLKNKARVQKEFEHFAKTGEILNPL